ncbi:MAG: DUF1579 family protein [Phycisphaerales bacterium]|nr:DUF1579 family protein [Phycisphaerales bacterium]
MNTMKLIMIAGMTTSLTAGALAQNGQGQKGDHRQGENGTRHGEYQRGDSLGKDAGWRNAQDRYFGKADGTELARLNDLAGAWRMTVTIYPSEAEKDARPGMDVLTIEGIAERRWTLDGNLLVERFAMSDDRRDLPLSTPGIEWNDHRDRTGHTALDGDRDGRAAESGRESKVRDTRENADRGRDVSNRTAGDRHQDLKRDHGDVEKQVEGRTPAHLHEAARQGLVMWGWNPADSTFDVVWTDDEHSALRTGTGELEDGTLTITGSYTDVADGETYETRNVLELLSPDEQRYTMYTDAGLLSAEKKRVEIVYTRITDPAIPMAQAAR